MVVLPDKQGKFYVPLFNSKSGTSHQEAESRRGQYTAGGEISDTLFFRDSVSEPEIGHARPPAVPRLKTRTSRPQGGQSQHRAEARCAPASRFCFFDALRGVLRRKKARQGNEYPNGLKTS